jgi:hypothetical protein
MTRFDLSRRGLLTAFGGGLALTQTGPALAQAVFDVNPFRLGVTAGDPLPDGFVIWTRLAPDPLAYGSGMPNAPMAVKWEVAADRGFRTVVRSGEAIARPELGHSVHVEVEGLEPARAYFYRFTVGDERSGVGRAKTAPVVGAALAQAKFGIVGCQAYESGYYTASPPIAAEDLDFIFCYGDYIYEGRGNPVYQNAAGGPMENVRASIWAARSTAWTTIADAIRNTRWTPTCRPRAPRPPGSPSMTTTRSTTTGSARSIRTAPRRGLPAAPRGRHAGLLRVHADAEIGLPARDVDAALSPRPVRRPDGSELPRHPPVPQTSLATTSSAPTAQPSTRRRPRSWVRRRRPGCSTI